MTNTVATARGRENPASPETGADTALGWYFYGITRPALLDAALADADDASRVDADAGASSSDAGPLQLLECSGLAAVVRPVALADFSEDVLQQRLQSATALEAMVRRHNGVIEAVHARQAILPAKFGTIYTHAGDIESALRSAHDTVLRQLDRLEGCDEWAVHLYADRAVVRERIATADAAIERLRQEHAGARPGRAWFLERQLRDQLEAATQEALVTLAQETFDRLADCAVAGEISPVAAAGDAAGEVEVLRASFLVRREDTERFMEEVSAGADAAAGLRSECSGPWPPYSFAPWDDERAG